MKQQINEVKRMQQLAGILNENESTGIEDLENKPGYDKLISYLKTHKEDAAALAAAAKEMKADGLQEAIDTAKLKGYLTDVGIGAGLGALLGSILAGVADPAHAIDAILAGIGYAGGGAAVIGFPGIKGLKKDEK